jgi:uncharacterized membrane protein
MKRNTFYLFSGCIAVILLAIFWYSVEIHSPPFLIELSFILGIVIIYLARKKVTDLIEDERSAKITEQATMRTFQVFAVMFAAVSIGAVKGLLYVPDFTREHIRPQELFSPRIMGYFQLGLLCLLIFLYVGFRMYYARKYGDWETDEE